MARSKRIIKQKNTAKVGKPPGSLIYMGPRKDVPISIDVIEYNQESITERILDEISPDMKIQTEGMVTWVDVKGLHNLKNVENIGKIANIHALSLEDLLNVNQRPKIDIFHTYVYIVIQLLKFDEEHNTVESEQLSIILGNNYVLTFLEGPSDVFEAIKTRMKNQVGKIRTSSSDYLAYAILDIVVDDYYDVIEKIGERIESFEEKLMLQPHKMTIQEIYSLKRELLELRRAVWPIREIITKLDKGETELIKEKTSLYLRDLYDHSIQIIETAEIYRDLISGLVDVYLSTTGHRLNEIIKVLTILSSIFIPLTFIVGIYGMNFKNMPELNWTYGYYICLGAMMLMAICMLIYFRWRKWL